MATISEVRLATDPLATLEKRIQQSENNGGNLEKVVAGKQDGKDCNFLSFVVPVGPSPQLPKVTLVVIADSVDTAEQMEAVRTTIEAQGKALLFLAPIFDAGAQKMVAVCRDRPVAATPPVMGVAVNVPAPGPPSGGAVPKLPLSWDNVPLRQQWSQKLIALVSQNRADLEKGNPDGFVSGYSTLSSDSLKIKFWAELVVAVAKFESDWNPKTVFHEPPPLGVNSIGLLQLSLQDQNNHRLSPRISREDELQNPLLNLEWGVTIFTKLVARDGVVASGRGSTSRGAARYWSVLRAGATHKLDAIKALTKKNVGL